MGRSNFRNLTNIAANNYASELLETRVINVWEHTASGTDIVALNASTGTITGTLAVTPIPGNEIRVKNGTTGIKRFIINTVTPGVGKAFTATSTFKEEFPTSIYGTPTEAESNKIWTPIILRKFRIDEERDYTDGQ